MNAVIDELFELGSEVIDHEREAANQARADQQAKDDAEFRRKVDLIADATGVDADTLINSLGLRFASKQFDYPFALVYLGSTVTIRVAPPRGWGNETKPDEVVFDSGYKAATPRESLAKFVTSAQRKYLAKQENLVKRLRAAEGLERFSSLKREETAWLATEVQQAALAHLLRLVPNERSTQWYFELWLENADLLDADLEPLQTLKREIRQRYETDQQRDKLLTFIQRRENPHTSDSLDCVPGAEVYDVRLPLTCESLDVLRAAAQAAGLADDRDVARAIAELENELANWQQRSERELRHTEFQQAAFQPFRYYEVRYSLMGESENGEAPEMEWNAFDVLHEQPAEDGFYHTLGGMTIKPRNIFAVLRHEVKTAQDYLKLGWSRHFKQPTDCGEICIVPVGAELIGA